MRALCADIAARCAELRHVHMPRVLVSFTPCRNRSRYGLQARVTPLRFRGGALVRRHGPTEYQVQRFFVDGREMPGLPPAGMQPYPGGRLLSYDLATGRFAALASAPEGEGVITMNMDTRRKRIYALTWPSGIFNAQGSPAQKVRAARNAAESLRYSLTKNVPTMPVRRLNACRP